MSHSHHDPTSGHDFAAANIRHFDETAHEYDARPDAVELTRRLAAAMRKAYPFNEDSTIVMEYACGTGLISRELAAYTKSIVGVDISQGMVNQFNNRVENQGIPPEEMKAVCVELKGEEGELDGIKFDVIVCASSYHHFASIEDVTRILAYFLKPGGALLVADLLKNEDSDDPNHPHNSGGTAIQYVVAHKGGFHEEDIRKVFESAGLESFSFEESVSAKMKGANVKLFLAKGTKPIIE